MTLLFVDRRLQCSETRFARAQRPLGRTDPAHAGARHERQQHYGEDYERDSKRHFASFASSRMTG
jgi:hypothetical protein